MRKKGNHMKRGICMKITTFSLTVFLLAFPVDSQVVLNSFSLFFTLFFIKILPNWCDRSASGIISLKHFVKEYGLVKSFFLAVRNFKFN